MVIRKFRYTDLEALIQIAKVSFAEENLASGITPDDFVKQVRTVTRGWMIPFKIMTTLAGIKWELFVAEIDGKVVGCGSCIGTELSNLMVDPDYRRRGIGKALLLERLQHLAQQGNSLATTTVLTSNQASLGNVFKQGFEVFDKYSIWETLLPFKQKLNPAVVNIVSRPVEKLDKGGFKELEKQCRSQKWLQIRGSAAPNYFLSPTELLLGRFTGDQHWSRIFLKDEVVIGFSAVSTNKNQNKGIVFRPVISVENLEYLSSMLDEASGWLMQLGKGTIQITIPEEHAQLSEELQRIGWTKTQSWFQLVRWLDKNIGLNGASPVT